VLLSLIVLRALLLLVLVLLLVLPTAQLHLRQSAGLNLTVNHSAVQRRSPRRVI
jgi:hypothetical protein